MSRTHKALITLALGLALAGATTAVAAADPPTPTHDQTDQRGALYQSELRRNLQLRTQAGSQVLAEHGLAAQRKALYQSEQERTLARHRALGAIAAQPAARTDPAAPSPGVDVFTTLLVGLVGGLLGGAGVTVGWTATTRQRRSRAARAGTRAGLSRDADARRALSMAREPGTRWWSRLPWVRSCGPTRAATP